MVLFFDILNNNNESNLRTKRTLTVRLISLKDLGIAKHLISAWIILNTKY